MTTASSHPSPSIFDLKTMGVTGAVVSCSGCGWINIVAWDGLRLANKTPFPDVARLKRFACSACGSKSVGVMPDCAPHERTRSCEGTGFNVRG
jgi:hypothetical protein